MSRPGSSSDPKRRSAGAVDARPIFPLLCLALFASVLLFGFRAKDQTDDSLNYALAAATGEGLYNAHHLLFAPIVRLFERGLASVGLETDVIGAGQIHGIVWSVVALLSIHYVARRVFGATGAGILAALLLLVSKGFWVYATQVDAYAPSIGCLGLAAAVAASGADGPSSYPRLGCLALCLTLAVLYSQANVLFAVPLGAYLMTGEGDRLARTSAVLGCAGALVLSVYLLVFLGVSRSTGGDDFLEFCLLYARHPDWGGLDSLSASGMASLLWSQARSVVALPYPSPRSPMAAAALAGAALLFLGYHARRLAASRRHSRLRLLFLVWLALHWGFYWWWLPGIDKYTVVSLFPLLLLSLLAVDDLKRRFPRTGRWLLPSAAMACLGLGAHNLRAAILPIHASPGRLFEEARDLAERIPPKTIVHTIDRVADRLRYYFPEVSTLRWRTPLYFHYQGRPTPKGYDLHKELRLAIRASLVAPTHRILGQSGYTMPEAWLSYFEWLLSYEWDPERQVGRHRRFGVIRAGPAGEPYLLLHPSPIEEVPNLETLLRRVDLALGGWSSKRGGVFESWLRADHDGILR